MFLKCVCVFSSFRNFCSLVLLLVLFLLFYFYYYYYYLDGLKAHALCQLKFGPGWAQDKDHGNRPSFGMLLHPRSSVQANLHVLLLPREACWPTSQPSHSRLLQHGHHMHEDLYPSPLLAWLNQVTSWHQSSLFPALQTCSSPSSSPYTDF